MVARILVSALIFWLALLLVGIAQSQELDPTKVSYNIDYKSGTPLYPVTRAEDVLVVREGQTIILEWDQVTTASSDSSQSWDIVPNWSRTDAMTRFKPSDQNAIVVFDQVLTLAQGYWKFRVWSFYDYGNGIEKRSKVPSKEVGILIVAPDPPAPNAPVTFTIRLQ